MDISVIVPVYNTGEYVKRCIESIAYQTYSGDVECIIVADAPTDRSMEIIETFISTYQGSIQFKLLYHDNNKGLAAARNTGVNAACGDYIFHLDSDDYCDSDMLQKMHAKAKQADADILITNFWLTHENTEEYHSYVIPETRIERIRDILLQKYSWTMFTKLIKRSLYTKHNIQQVEGVDYGEDFLTTIILMYYAQRVVHLPEAFVHHITYNENSYTFAISQKSINNLVKCNNLIVDFIEGKKDGYLFKDDLIKMKITSFFFLLQKVWASGRKELPYYEDMPLSRVFRCPGIKTRIKIKFAIVRFGYKARLLPTSLFIIFNLKYFK